jgi:hypothetical protein
MNLPLVVEAGAADQPIGAVEKGNACATLRENERSATPQQASTKHSDTPIYSGFPHMNFNS